MSRLKNTKEQQQREKLLNSLGKVSFIPSVQKEEILEHMLNSCELTCVRAKPTQSSIKQSSPLLQTGLDSPSIRSRSRTKQKQSSDSCVCTNTNQKRWLSGPPGAHTTHGWWEVQDPFSAFGTVGAIPADEASNEEFWLR